MTLDPQARWILDVIEQSGKPALNEVSAVEARKMYLEAMAILNPEKPDVYRIEDRTIPGSARHIPIRIYTPKPTDDEALPVLVFYHGGGYTIGDLDSHDTPLRALANESGCVIVSIDYRMGPEHRFPAAVDDCYAATCWVFENAATLGCDAARLAVGGDSAGGNLAAVVTQIAKRENGPKIAFQLLIYPATDMSASSESHKRLSQGYRLTGDLIKWFTDNYIAPKDYGDVRASPSLEKDLSGLPPALIITAGYDPLVDEGQEYARRLNEAGVPTTYTCYKGMIHGFFGWWGVFEAAKQAISQAASTLRVALRKK